MTQRTLVQRALEEGFAPIAALLAMVIVGVIVTAGFYLVSADARAEGADLAAQARRVAEVGLERALAEEEIDRQEGRREPVTVFRSVSGVAASYRIEVEPAGPSLTLVTSEGRVTSGNREIVRSVSILVATGRIAPDPDAGTGAARAGVIRPVRERAPLRVGTSGVAPGR